MVATKAALSIRVDALADDDSKSTEGAPSIGVENRAKLESRLRALEHRLGIVSTRSSAADGPKQSKYEASGSGAAYNESADAPAGLLSTHPAAVDEKAAKKAAKAAKKAAEAAAAGGMDVDDGAAELSKEERKAAKKAAKLAAANGDGEVKEKKSKKRRADDDDEEPAVEDGEKKKKKSKKTKSE